LYTYYIRNNYVIMKKFIAITALLSFAVVAQAQTAGTLPLRNQGVMREGVTKPEARFKIGSSTRPIMGSTTRMMGSTTRPIGERGEKKNEKIGERKELKMAAKKGEVLATKDALVKRLTLALDTLTKVKTNLSTYIDKRVSENKPIGNAKTLLATANTKIETARKAVTAVIAWKPDAKAASTTEISLTKPRETANAAIKAVHDARKAIDAVVKELRSVINPEGKKKVPETAATGSTTNQ
jgi:hypothetical protein